MKLTREDIRKLYEYHPNGQKLILNDVEYNIMVEWFGKEWAEKHIINNPKLSQGETKLKNPWWS